MKNKTFIVYKYTLMRRLVEKGHKVIDTMPNLKQPNYLVWKFEVDDTFEEDFNEAVSLERGRHNGR